MSDNRERLLAAIIACEPCKDETWLREGAEHWPENVTLSWLLRNPERGSRVVTVAKRRWLGLAMLSRHAPDRLATALQVVVARAKSRAVGPHARAVFMHSGKASNSALDARGGQFQPACDVLASAVRAARAARASCDAEALQQVEDLAAAADGFVP